MIAATLADCALFRLAWGVYKAKGELDRHLLLPGLGAEFVGALLQVVG